MEAYGHMPSTGSVSMQSRCVVEARAYSLGSLCFRGSLHILPQPISLKLLLCTSDAVMAQPGSKCGGAKGIRWTASHSPC